VPKESLLRSFRSAGGLTGPLPWQLGTTTRNAAAVIGAALAPGGDGLPSAAELGVADAFVSLSSRHLGAVDARRLALLLSGWDRLGPLVGGAGARRFRDLSADDQQKVLLAWCDSPVPQIRSAFQGLRKALLGIAYMVPGATGRNPAWDELGYPGPLGPPDPAPGKAITPHAVDRDAVLSCDVCIIGSGAGGGTAAGVLAEAGLDVVVLEAGGDHEGEFDGAELAGYSSLYLNGGALATADQGVGLLAGATLGGGTTVNFATCFRTPDDVRQEWAGMGVPDFAGQDFTDSLDAVWTRLGVNTDHSRPSAREAVMARGMEALGWPVGVLARNVVGCDQGDTCGFCGFGCRLGAKQSTARTWLVDAHRAGARILVGTRADRVVVRHGRARGVEARTVDGHAVTVHAAAVVVCAGAVHTPAVLRRSGLDNPNIGRHLRLHPVTGVAGTFDEDVRPWEGAMQAVYSDRHRELAGGYGVTYESAPFHPSAFTMYAPWRDAGSHRDLMKSLRHTVPIGVLLRDTSEGRVRVRRNGDPVVTYRLNRTDVGHVRVGVEGAARVLEAAGARKIFSGHAKGLGYEPGRGTVDQFMSDADACGWGAGRCVFMSFHIQGSARMGGSPKDSACNPLGETWEVPGLYVCDGSAFPTASGVNPMITIEAIAHLTATRLARTLAGRTGG
jgi:long-chain-alcohol oxidase